MASQSKRGFAAMDPEEQREIASEGGRAAHRRGASHESDSGDDDGGSARSSNGGHRQGTPGRGRTSERSTHHGNAAFHHESAAHHHRQAAKHHTAGDIEEADRHTRQAHSHSQTAHEHSQRGFAAMDPEEHREISRKGGLASHGGRGSDVDEEDVEDEHADAGDDRRGGQSRGGNGSSRSGGTQQATAGRKALGLPRATRRTRRAASGEPAAALRNSTPRPGVKATRTTEG